MPLLGTAATELAFSHIRKDARKNEYSQFIGNYVGKERNTMYIIKWFIKKTKQLVQACKDWKSRRKIEKWSFENEVTDEQLRRETEENEREYQRQCKEEDARLNKQIKNIVEDQRTKRQIEEWSMQEEWEKRFDNEKDGRGDDPPGVDETTLINKQCAAVDPEEIPLWLERANEECLRCRLLPEFCQCQYEE